MRICALICSPRVNGNTEVLMKEVLSIPQQQGIETEFIQAAGKKIYPCDACGSCQADNQCRIDDDMKAIHASLIAADGIVIGTPVYCWSVSAQAKIIMDRTYAFRSKRLLRGKIFAAVVVARRGGASQTMGTLATFAITQRMTMAGGVAAYGNRRGEVLKDEEGISRAHELGEAIARLLAKR